MIPVLRLIETAFIIKTLVGRKTREHNSNPRTNRETAKHILRNSLTAKHKTPIYLFLLPLVCPNAD